MEKELLTLMEKFAEQDRSYDDSDSFYNFLNWLRMRDKTVIPTTKSNEESN